MHAVQGSVMAGDLKQGLKADTLEGPMVEFDLSKVNVSAWCNLGSSHPGTNECMTQHQKHSIPSSFRAWS